MRSACLLLTVPLVALASRSEAHAQFSWGLAMEAGAEYDSNVHRVDGTDPAQQRGAPLFRLGARTYVSNRSGGGVLSRLFVLAATKTFATREAQNENAFIFQGNGETSIGLVGPIWAGIRASGYTAKNYELASPQGAPAPNPNPEDMQALVVLPPRTFSLAGADLFAILPGPDQHRITAAVGLRYFQFDSEKTSDWWSDSYGIQYAASFPLGRQEDGRSLDVAATYFLQRRDYFRGDAFTTSCPDDVPQGGDCSRPANSPGVHNRADLFHSLGAEVLYSGGLLAKARYELSLVDSNSYGQSVLRQRLELKLVTELFDSGYFLTVAGAVLLNLYLDALPLTDVDRQTFITIEEENRNSLALGLSHDFDQLELEARYTIFSNEFASDETAFRRQTFYLGAVYRFKGM